MIITNILYYNSSHILEKEYFSFSLHIYIYNQSLRLGCYAASTASRIH